jgi:CheY-like chemotaxis protein
MRVLEVSLRKAGFSVTTAVSVSDAFDKLQLDAPDLIISETTFPDGDGFELRSKVRATPEWDEIPFIFLTAEAAIENKIRGLELGVDDYLTKPIYIKEIVTRINILLQKKQRTRFEERRDGRTRFAGRVADMPVVDVIQTIEISRKSGVIQFVGDRGRQAAIYFRDGRVIDAEAGALQGEDAVYRLLTWSEGEFEVVFRTVRRREVIAMSSQGLLMEGMRRLDEWSRLLEQLPPLSHRFDVDAAELSTRLGDVPDHNNTILRLIDGRRTLLEVIDASDVGDLECLQAISRLYFEEMLVDLDHGAPVRASTGKPVPLTELEEAASGPIGEDDDRTGLDEHGEYSEGPGSDRPGPHGKPIPGRPPLRVEAASAPADDADSFEPFEADLAPVPPVTRSTPHGVPIVPDPDPHSIDEDFTSGVDDEPGALAGSYRPSSLRLIDEAVAAAQAIEPSLFEDDEVDALLHGPNTRAANGVPKAEHADFDSIPQRIDEPTPSAPVTHRPPPETATSGPMPVIGARMIGSLGRDRAETSGEFDLGASRPAHGSTQRELVTILPRRVTREMLVVSADALPTPPPTAITRERADATPTEPIGSPAAPSDTARTARGPSAPALALLVLAGLLAILAVYLYVTRTREHAEPTPPSAPPPPPIAVSPPPTPIPVVPLAREAPVPRDAGAPVDAPRPRPTGAPLTTDPEKSAAAQAKALMEQAAQAFARNDFSKTLEQANQSLRLRRTARTLILKAQALQGLGRVDDALATLVEAEQAAPNYPNVLEMRARLLWGAARRDEARAAMQRYLDLAPNGPAAAQFARWIADPR